MDVLEKLYCLLAPFEINFLRYWFVHIVCPSANKISMEKLFLYPALKLMKKYIK